MNGWSLLLAQLLNFHRLRTVIKNFIFTILNFFILIFYLTVCRVSLTFYRGSVSEPQSRSLPASAAQRKIMVCEEIQNALETSF